MTHFEHAAFTAEGGTAIVEQLLDEHAASLDLVQVGRDALRAKALAALDKEERDKLRLGLHKHAAEARRRLVHGRGHLEELSHASYSSTCCIVRSKRGDTVEVMVVVVVMVEVVL